MESPMELNELMARIRAAVDTHRPASTPAPDGSRRPIYPPIPGPLSEPPAPLAGGGGREGHSALEEALATVASMLPRARQKTEVRENTPKALRFLYRNQGGFNGILLEAMDQLLFANRQLQAQNSRLLDRLDTLEANMARQRDWSGSISRAHDQQREWMRAVESCLGELGGSQAELERHLGKRIAKIRNRVEPAARPDMADDYDLDSVENLQEQLNGVDKHANRLGDHLKNLQAQVDDLGQRSDDRHAQYRHSSEYQQSLIQNTRQLEERQHNDASYLKNQLWFLQRLVQPLLNKEAESGSTNDDENEKKALDQSSSETAAHDLDALYVAFEEAMRGNRSEVKQRLEIYLPYITAAAAGTAERPILDLGCGRGEWLELLGERGQAASGVDLNHCMIEICRERDLPATFANALDHLQSMPEASCGAVTAFHLIEHLPIPVLIRFFRECRRVLQPGGVAIFETPNPYNVLVGSGYFYHDFTHQRPLPPTSTKFLVEQMGFAKTEILPLHPWEESAKVHGDDAKALEWRFNELFYGPQDYALIATP